MGAVVVRDARLPDEEPRLAQYVGDLQAFGAPFEPNRRLDPGVGREYLAKLLAEAAAKDGRVFVAERDGRLVGWAVALIDDDEIYVVEAERRFGYVSELFVEESARGAGAGRVLVEACETHFRSRAIPVAMIGVVEGNERARASYLRYGYRPASHLLKKKL